MSKGTGDLDTYVGVGVYGIKIKNICNLLIAMDLDVTEMNVKDVVDAVMTKFDNAYTMQDANTWGDKYFQRNNHLPSIKDLSIIDSNELMTIGDLNALCTSRINTLNKSRMSLSGIQNLIEQYGYKCNDVNGKLRSDLDKLETYVQEGVMIYTDKNFIPNSNPGNLSRSYKLTHRAVDAMLHEARLNGLVLFFQPHCMTLLGNVHFQRLGWATKAEKVKGRQVCDCSSVASRAGPQVPLNTNDVTDWAENTFGAINHPTITEILQMIHNMVQLYGLENIVVWKMDISGAYTLLNFNPSCVHLMCFTLLSGIIVTYITGNFGWTAMPAVFEVVTRVLRKFIGVAIKGMMVMYVDDVIGCSTRNDLTYDMMVSSNIITTLLGENSEAIDKRDTSENTPTRSIVCIGWEICLKHYIVDVSPRNRQKAIYYFYIVDIDKPVTIEYCQKLCSLAQRYSMIYRELSVLMYGLYLSIGGIKNLSNYHTRMLHPDTKLVIKLWRAYLILNEFLFTNDKMRGRPIPSLLQSKSEALIEFDGSLYGIGFRLFKLDNDAEVFSSSMGYLTHINLDNDSSYQNAMELNALAAGLFFGVMQGWKNIGIVIRGDSQSVLYWSQKMTFKSKYCIGVLSFIVQLLEYSGCYFSSNTQFIDTTANFVCDGLSRRGSINSPQTNNLLKDILNFGNPLWTPVDEYEFIHKLKLIKSWLKLKIKLN